MAVASKRQQQLAMVAAIRGHVGPVAQEFTDVRLLRLVQLVGSVGLACDALTMIPQPFWVIELAHGKGPKTSARAC